MQICGIVAEYNPFHNGHKYQIERLRELGATHIVAVMSGSFVQRSEPAIFPKFERAMTAARNGVDLVIELPVAYAISSSERFGFGAVSILDSLGCVDKLCFGSEAGYMDPLVAAKEAIADRKVQKRTAELMELGDSYPKARQKAIEVFYPDIADVVKTPNNILGLDYLKAIDRLASEIEPMTIGRKYVEHDSMEVVSGFASASFVRNEIYQKNDISAFVPVATRKAYFDGAKNGRISRTLKAIESAVLFKLRLMTVADFKRLPDSDNGLGERLYAASCIASSLEELYDLTKTKCFTMSRVKRLVLYAFLGIDKTFYDYSVPYIRVLAVGEGGEEILSAADKNCKLPMSQSLITLSETSAAAAKFAKAEVMATDIYNLTLYPRGSTGEDFKQRLFRLSKELPIDEKDFKD